MVKYYRYDFNKEAKKLIDEKFGGNDISFTMNEQTITLNSKEGDFVIEYKIVDNPLVYAGHQFEELREYHIEYVVNNKKYTTKQMHHRLSKVQIVEKAITAWVNVMTKKEVKKEVTSKKAKEENELLKTLKEKKNQK